MKMKRRTFIAGAGIVGLSFLTGCSNMYGNN